VQKNPYYNEIVLMEMAVLNTKKLYLSTYLICVIGLDLMVMLGLLCLSLGNQVKVFG